MRSPIRWFGGKHYLAPLIINLMPPHTCYVEPFGGGANVIAQKPPVEVEVFNDIDEDLINFLMVLRSDPEKLVRVLETIPYSIALFERMKWEEKPNDPFERAVNWFYVMRSSICFSNNHKSGWRRSNQRNSARDYQSAVKGLLSFAKRFRTVMIERRDFREIISFYDSPETLFYVDPPYRGREFRYKGGFADQDHIDLAETLMRIKGKAIVSYYEDELINQLYQEWRKIEVGTKKMSVVIGKGEGIERPAATELLYMNYSDNQMSIFEIC